MERSVVLHRDVAVIKLRFESLDLGGGHAGVLGVRAVKLTAHSAHRCGYGLALGEFATRRLGNLPDCFDAQDAGKAYRGRVPLAREELRAVDPEGLDPDQNPPGLGLRNRPLLEFERLRPTRFLDYRRSHRFPE